MAADPKQILERLMVLAKPMFDEETQDKLDTVMDCYVQIETFYLAACNVRESVQTLYDGMSKSNRQSAHGIRAHVWGSADSANSAQGDEWRQHLPSGRSDGSFQKSLPELQRVHAKQLILNPESVGKIGRDVYKAFFMNEKGKMKSHRKAIGVISAITTLATIAPKLFAMIQDGATCNELSAEFIKLAGPAVWGTIKSVGTANLRRFLIMSLGPNIANTFVAVISIECLVALFMYMLGNVEARKVISKISTGVAIACTAAIYHTNALAAIVKNVAKKAISWTREFFQKIPNFVRRAIKFLTAQVGISLTTAGIGIMMASQTGNAVMLLGMLGAQAGTGTAIASLSGAAATNAGLAWLGGGTIASGGGGMVAGKALLATASTVGMMAAGVGLGVLAIIALEQAMQPTSVNDVAKEEFGQGAGVDEDPTQDICHSMYQNYMQGVEQERKRQEEEYEFQEETLTMAMLENGIQTRPHRRRFRFSLFSGCF